MFDIDNFEKLLKISNVHPTFIYDTKRFVKALNVLLDIAEDIRRQDAEKKTKTASGGIERL